MMVNAAEPRHRDETMDISFFLGLPPAAEKELEARVDKGEVISSEEIKTKYGVDAAKSWTHILPVWQPS